MPIESVAYGTNKPGLCIEKMTITMREPEADELLLKVAYCGLCHSDAHKMLGEWGAQRFPLVPGHEVIGKVAKIGADLVGQFQMGEVIGCGCLSSCCNNCHYCDIDFEQNCPERRATYGGNDRDGRKTTGGYGEYIIVTGRCAIRVNPNCNIRDAAPLLCAGITTYSPLVQHGAKNGGMRIAVLGLGGLGHMAVQIANAMKNEVYVFGRNDKKRALAQKLGAKELIVVPEGGKTSESYAEYVGTFDLIINTITAPDQPFAFFVSLLKPRGVHVLVSIPPPKQPVAIPVMELVNQNKVIAGSNIGGIKETQEMFDFCVANNLMPMVEHIKPHQIAESIPRMIAGDVHFRFVADYE